MKIRVRAILLLCSLALLGNAAFVSAQTPGEATAARDPMEILPASDVVVFVDMRRILTEVIPRLLARSPAVLGKLTASLNEINQKTGINVLSINRIAVGVHLFDPATASSMKKSNFGVVIIARGDFDSNRLVPALRRELKERFHEETYGGRTIYSELKTPAEPLTETVALSLLDTSTLAIGDLAQVRATIDAGAGRGQVDPALVQLARRDAGSLVGAAAIVPPALSKSISEDVSGGDEMGNKLAGAVSAIRQLFCSVGMTPTNFQMLLGARFEKAEQAASVSDLLLGVRQQTLPQVEDKTLHDLMARLQLTAQGEDLQLTIDVSNAEAQELVTSIVNDGQAKPAAQGKKPSRQAAPTNKRRSTRQRRSTRRRG